MNKRKAEIIVAYRRLISERYQYDVIQKVYELPPNFDEDRVAEYRAYFLDYLYPPPQKREHLDATFQQLDAYIKTPEKLIKILIDSAGILFKYGRHLRKILKAGMQALKAFRTANQFETKLTQHSRKLNLHPPFTKANIYTLIRSIPREEIDHFIEYNVTLFSTLHDRKLVSKIIDVLNDLIAKMKKRPATYSSSELAALEMGLELISTGNQLFDKLSPKEQKELLDFATNYERQMIEEIFHSEV